MLHAILTYIIICVKEGLLLINLFLKELRDRNGMSREELVRIPNVSYVTINRWEMKNNNLSRPEIQNLDLYCRNHNIQSASEWVEERGVQQCD